MQLWFARGGTALTVYGIYGTSGARWERSKKNYVHELLKAIQFDRISRGQIPCILMGDFNLELQDSIFLRQSLQQKFWFDLRSTAVSAEADKPTCHKSKGSQIDHIFISPSLIDQCCDFQIQKLPEFKDHSMVSGKLSCPTSSQIRTSLRSVAVFTNLSKAKDANYLISPELDSKFQTAIESKDVNLAFKLWSQGFEKVLHKIALHLGETVPQTAAAKRGQIIFHEQRKHPKVIRQQASTLKGRKLWKAHCQIQEILRAPQGTRRDRTIENLKSVRAWLSPSQDESFLTSLQTSNYERISKILHAALDQNDLDDKQQRIKEWKRSIRKDVSASYQHLKKKAAHPPVQVSTVDGIVTANLSDRLHSIEQVWKKIYSTHQQGEPSLRRFMEIYGPTLKTSNSDLGTLTDEILHLALYKMHVSAPGLDHISTSELQIAISWSPDLLNHLTTLLKLVEDIQTWPDHLTKGVVAFLPKDASNPTPSPDEFRPITILSCIYRLWASARHLQLAKNWYPKWHHKHSFGGKSARSAGQLAYETCLQLTDAASQGSSAAGVSFDLRKCFDTIPFRLALDIFLTRGCDPKIVSTLKSFYLNHKKFFRLEGHHSAAFQPSCGIVQGCPLSMMVLSSLVTSWLEYNEAHLPATISRSYADDMSSVVEGSCPKMVKTGLRDVYDSTHKFTSVAGLQINAKKTFTFGPKTFQKSVPQIQQHETVFRLVGCSIKTSSSFMWTPLEQSRLKEWTTVIQRIQNLPQSWATKVQIMQSVMSKLTFGQGTHFLQVSRDVLRSMRATVVRALLNAYNYNSAPNVIFALLAPPSVDPSFALQLSAFNLIRRMFNNPEARLQLQRKLTTNPANQDGPLARIQQLIDSPYFSSTMNQFLSNRLPEHKWQHALRDAYRAHLWTVLAKDRPQHYAGVESGVNRSLTCTWLSELQSQADMLQQRCDQDDELAPEPIHDPRVQQKVLRLLFSGGLQNPERTHRHKNKDGKVLCLCKKAEPSLEHISWFCPRFNHIRDPVIPLLPTPIDQLPQCFRACAIVPNNYAIDSLVVKNVQKALVQIWQSHIDDWYNGSDNFLIVPEIFPPTLQVAPALPMPSNSLEINQSTASSSSQPVPRNGHVLKIMDSGGVFCQKCGKSTKLQKHQRLKILSKPCVNPDLPPSEWLQSPGAINNRHRLEQAWIDLHRLHNKPGHKFFWNQHCGKDRTKDDFGLLWCENCGKEWPWKDRHNNMTRSKCVKTSIPIVPPAWVTSSKNRSDLFSFKPIVLQPASSSAASSVPRRRLVGKQQVPSQASDPSPDVLPRTGVG